LSEKPPHLPRSAIDQAGRLADELLDLLTNRNGFFAYGPALQVLPSNSTAMSWGLAEWNEPGQWKHDYQSFVDSRTLLRGRYFRQSVFDQEQQRPPYSGS
jgi:hypothetical protein